MFGSVMSVWKEKGFNQTTCAIVVCCARKAIKKEAEEVGEVYCEFFRTRACFIALELIYLGQKTQARRTSRDSQTLGVSFLTSALEVPLIDIFPS